MVTGHWGHYPESGMLWTQEIATHLASLQQISPVCALSLQWTVLTLEIGTLPLSGFVTNLFSWNGRWPLGGVGSFQLRMIDIIPLLYAYILCDYSGRQMGKLLTKEIATLPLSSGFIANSSVELRWPYWDVPLIFSCVVRICFCCKLIQRCNTKYLNFVCVLNWLQNQEICKPCPLNIHCTYPFQCCSVVCHQDFQSMWSPSILLVSSLIPNLWSGTSANDLGSRSHEPRRDFNTRPDLWKGGRAGRCEQTTQKYTICLFTQPLHPSFSELSFVQNPTSSFIQNPTISFVQKSISSFVQHPEIFQRGLRCWRWNWGSLLHWGGVHWEGYDHYVEKILWR